MGKIFYIMGKSASGKDTFYRRLCADEELGLKTVTLYTTRPMREGEREGAEYHFTDEEGAERLEREGRVIEQRAYHTACGLWRYLTVDDGQIHPEKENYLMIGTLESYQNMQKYFGKDTVVAIYIEVEDGERLFRALTRERKERRPRYAEMCRRFLADENDFSEEKLRLCGISRRFENTDAKACLERIKNYIKSFGNQ